LNALLVGRVTEYDAERGLGTVAVGDVTYAFHCTAVADGTRLIDVDTDVAFLLAPGLGGELEGRELTVV
jgi:hypothetical protein